MKRFILTCLLAGQLWHCGTAAKVQAVIYNSPPDPLPSTLSFGDVLNRSALSLPGADFLSVAAPGSVVNLLPGGSLFGGTYQGTVNTFAGSLSLGSSKFDGAMVNALGGSIGGSAARNGSVLNIEGAQVSLLNSLDSTVNFRSGEFLGGFFDSTVLNIYAPLVSGEFLLESSSTVNIFGGQLNSSNGAILHVRGEFHLRMKSAKLGGASIPGLTPGASVEIVQRNVVLSGLLADGSATNMLLDDLGSSIARFHFFQTSVVRVTLVPEPTGAAGVVVALVCATWWRRRAVGTCDLGEELAA